MVRFPLRIEQGAFFISARIEPQVPTDPGKVRGASAFSASGVGNFTTRAFAFLFDGRRLTCWSRHLKVLRFAFCRVLGAAERRALVGFLELPAIRWFWSCLAAPRPGLCTGQITSAPR
jgi:hypothetical protein